jgi:archaeal flagellin FlaB
MKKKYMEKLIGKYCKIVTKEPGDSRASVVSGTVEDIDYEDGFILVDSAQGLGCLSINTVIAIKPGHAKPKHQKRKIKAEETASIGIGTLIVFIATVLVAAVAASVIIQTSEQLQNRAYAVGKQTIREVSSGVSIIGMTGYTNEGKTKMEYLAISLRPRAGSYDIDLNETLVYIEYDNLTVLSLDYANDDGVDEDDSGTISANVSEDGIFHTLNHSYLTSTVFGAIAVRDSDKSIVNSYGMGTSDMVMIIINLTASFSETNGLEPGEEFYGRIVPETGAAGIFMVSAPNAFDHRVVDL